eukprot:1977655-Amphidinium_carterae.1
MQCTATAARQGDARSYIRTMTKAFVANEDIQCLLPIPVHTHIINTTWLQWTNRTAASTTRPGCAPNQCLRVRFSSGAIVLIL